VTVVARDGATADSLDTAAYVLGPESGLKLVEATDGAAALIVRSVGGKTETHASRRIGEFLVDGDDPAAREAAPEPPVLRP
jgi:thiamine biosynthesis lipoprotein